MKKLPLTSLWKKLEFEDYYQTCLISLPKKKNKGGVASRNVTKAQDEDFLMNSVAQCYGQYLTNVRVFRTNEFSINSTMIRCSPMMLVNLQ